MQAAEAGNAGSAGNKSLRGTGIYKAGCKKHVKSNWQSILYLAGQ